MKQRQTFRLGEMLMRTELFEGRFTPRDAAETRRRGRLRYVARASRLRVRRASPPGVPGALLCQRPRVSRFRWPSRGRK